MRHKNSLNSVWRRPVGVVRTMCAGHLFRRGFLPLILPLLLATQAHANQTNGISVGSGGTAAIGGFLQQNWPWLLSKALLVIVVVSVTYYLVRLNIKYRRALTKQSREIYARRKIQKKLRKSQRDKKLILENIAEMVNFNDCDMVVQCVNSRGCEVVGKTPEQIVGHHCYEIWGGRDTLCPDCPVKEAMETDRQCSRERETPDGKMWLVTGTPVWDYNGEIIGAFKTTIDITEHKRTEAELMRFRIAIDSSADAVGMSTPHGVHFYQNASFCELFGYSSAQELLAAGGGPALYEDRKVAKEVFDTIMGSGQWEGEVNMKAKDGRRLTVLLRAGSVTDDDGKILAVIGVHTDITERKEAEEKIRRSEAKFRDMVNLMPQSYAEFDLDGKYNYVNQVGLDMFGYEETDYKSGVNIMDVIAPEDHDKVQANIRKRLQGHTHTPNEYTMVRRDGSRFPALAYSTPIMRDGKPVGLRSVIVDITDRKRAEQERKRLLQRLQSIMDNVPAYVFLKDRRGLYTAVNKVYMQLLPPEVSDPVGHHDSDFFPPRLAEKFKNEDSKVMEDGRIVTKTEPIPLRDGRTIHAAVRLVPVRNDRGLVTGMVGVAMDITKQKRIEREMQEAKEQAEETNKTKGEFLANMSHEIRTPMTAILGFAEQLRDSHLSVSDRQNYLAVIQRNGEHLLDLINDVLDLSKIEAGRMTVEKTPTNIPSILSDVASMMRIRAEDKEISFSVEYESELPETIETDPSRLRQALVNLAGNAVKFTETGSVRIAVEFLPERFNGAPAVEFRVMDTGIGIPKQKLRSLYEPFVQADASTSRKYGGTGLGLAITRHIAELLDGDLSVASIEGKGSTFTLTIPTGPLEGVDMLDEPGEALNGDREHAENPHGASKPLKGMKILLAEDGPDNQLLIKTVLKNKAGAHVEVAPNGIQALEKVKQAGAFDLILMDMQMPRMDGYQATRELRRRGYKHPILALTAHAMEGDKQKSRAAGCDDHVSKPIRGSELIEAIMNQIKKVKKSKKTPDRKISSKCARKTKTDAKAPIRSAFSDDPDMADIVKQFVAGLADRVKDMKDALDHNDYQTLNRCAHQMKGAGGSYGYPPLSEQAEKLQQSADKQDAEGARLRLNELDNLCKRIITGCDAKAACGRSKP